MLKLMGKNKIYNFTLKKFCLSKPIKMPPLKPMLTYPVQVGGEFGPSLFLHLYFVYASNKASGEFGHMCAESLEFSLLNFTISTKISFLSSTNLALL